MLYLCPKSLQLIGCIVAFSKTLKYFIDYTIQYKEFTIRQVRNPKITSVMHLKSTDCHHHYSKASGWGHVIKRMVQNGAGPLTRRSVSQREGRLRRKEVGLQSLGERRQGCRGSKR